MITMEKVTQTTNKNNYCILATWWQSVTWLSSYPESCKVLW